MSVGRGIRGTYSPFSSNVGIFQAVPTTKHNNFHNLWSIRLACGWSFARASPTCRRKSCRSVHGLCEQFRRPPHRVSHASLRPLWPGHRPQPLRRCHRCGQGHRAVATGCHGTGALATVWCVVLLPPPAVPPVPPAPLSGRCGAELLLCWRPRQRIAISWQPRSQRRTVPIRVWRHVPLRELRRWARRRRWRRQPHRIRHGVPRRSLWPRVGQDVLCLQPRRGQIITWR